MLFQNLWDRIPILSACGQDRNPVPDTLKVGNDNPFARPNRSQSWTLFYRRGLRQGAAVVLASSGPNASGIRPKPLARATTGRSCPSDTPPVVSAPTGRNTAAPLSGPAGPAVSTASVRATPGSAPTPPGRPGSALVERAAHRGRRLSRKGAGAVLEVEDTANTAESLAWRRWLQQPIQRRLRLTG